MNIIERYESLVDNEKWEEALPVIKEIVDRDPSIDTSWFNYGVCLDEIGRHSEAAESFIKALELNIQDYGIHYRVFRSFFLANDLDQLYEFVVYLCDTFPEIRATLFGSDEYKELIQYKPFRELQEKYKEGNA